MRQQEASAVIPAPLAEVEGWLRHVELWPRFLVGLASVRRLGHERYEFRLVDGYDSRSTVACVRHLPAAHRFTWRALEGPRYAGVLDLREVDDHHTGVRLSIVAHPVSLLAGLAEMTMPRTGRAAQDVRNLEAQVVA
jgi:hypothetical protein